MLNGVMNIEKFCVLLNVQRKLHETPLKGTFSSESFEKNDFLLTVTNVQNAQNLLFFFTTQMAYRKYTWIKNQTYPSFSLALHCSKWVVAALAKYLNISNVFYNHLIVFKFNYIHSNWARASEKALRSKANCICVCVYVYSGAFVENAGIITILIKSVERWSRCFLSYLVKLKTICDERTVINHWETMR